MSSIDYRELRSLAARKLISALKRDGFYLERQRGSHQYFWHSDGRKVTVSFHHPGDIFPPKTLKEMIELQANWDLDDLRRLKVIPKRDP